MKKTIYDIAREAGVGVSTVSRALNNSGYVSEETMRKIEKASIGYTKSKYRSSVNTHGKSIGLIVSHDPEYFFVNSTYLNAMIGISAVARENDIHLILEISNQTERCLSLYKSGMVDGVILMGIKQDNTLIDSLLEMHCPLVLIGDYLDDSKKFCKIDIDDFAMAKEAVEHLITLGHTRIGFIGGSLEYASCQNRVAGYRAALEEAGINVSSQDCVFCNTIAEEKVSNLAKKLLYQRDRITAVITFNDSIAYTVYKVSKEMGILIPEGLSVVSFDDSDVAKCLSPGLTTVQQPSFEKGYRAARKLIQQMTEPNKQVESETLEGLLIFRDSCAPPPKIVF